MRISVVTHKEFKISDRQLRAFCKEELENMLASFNYAEGNNYYILDYFNKKVIVESPTSPILCGFPKEYVDEENFGFFQRTLSDDEWKWLSEINVKCYQFFFLCSESDRKNLVFSYDLTMKTPKDKKVVLHHKIVPYKLCKNGNLWLGLCHVSLSPNRERGRVSIFNRKTGERYNLIENRFEKVLCSSLNSEELMILEWMIKGLSDKLICDRLGDGDKPMPSTNFKLRKRTLYKKLEASTSAEAIYKAKMMGII